MFDGKKVLVYEIWKKRTKTCLQEKGYDIWYLVVTVNDSILELLPNSVKDKVVQFSLAKEL